MQNKNNHRRGFLKNLSIAVGSFVMLSGFEIKKSTIVEKQNFKTLPKSEADEIIKNEQFPLNVRLNPEPAPIEKNNAI